MLSKKNIVQITINSPDFCSHSNLLVSIFSLNFRFFFSNLSNFLYLRNAMEKKE